MIKKTLTVLLYVVLIIAVCYLYQVGMETDSEGSEVEYDGPWLASDLTSTLNTNSFNIYSEPHSVVIFYTDGGDDIFGVTDKEGKYLIVSSEDGKAVVKGTLSPTDGALEFFVVVSEYFNQSINYRNYQNYNVPCDKCHKK